MKVHTGSVFDPMKFQTYYFEPKDWELLQQHHLTVDFNEQKSQLLYQFSAPVGLMALSTSVVKETLQKHIEQMVGNPKYPAQTTAGDATELPYLILDAAIRYCRRTHVGTVFPFRLSTY